MRKLIVIALVAGCLGTLASVAMAARSIKVGDNYYVRARGVPTVTVSKGTRVTWNFRGASNPHSVTVRKGPKKFDSGVRTGGSYSRTMTRRGTYRLYCTVHGAANQSMKLVVK